MPGETTPLVNPTREISNGIDRTPISDSSVIGWDFEGGQIICVATDHGNAASASLPPWPTRTVASSFWKFPETEGSQPVHPPAWHKV